MQKPAQMHELLAVETNLEQAAVKIMEETIKNFKTKQHIFTGSIRRFSSFEEGVDPVIDQQKEVGTTVKNRLNYTKDFVIRHYDAAFQKELTNQNAKTDLIVDGKTIATDIPVTFLLGMEKKLKRLRTVYECIPTREPGINWIPDTEKGDGIYKSESPAISFQDKKIPKVVVLYEATKEHPAQVQTINEVINTGKYEKTIWSGMISPADQSKFLGKIDALLRAVGKARARANKEDVVKRNIGKELFDFIHND